MARFATNSTKATSVVIWTIAKVAIVLLIGGWCALFLRRFDVYFQVVIPAWCRKAGLAVIVAAGILVLGCGAVLSTRGIGARGDRLFPKEFVAFGPFRYVRNPMSLGAVALFCGLGLFECSLSLLLFAVLLFVFLHLVVIFVEEPGLERRFGDSYRSYKQSVNRWMPTYRRKMIERT
jgi:protein-S-isoprenylcysteine O-methyltransferase Ste14